MWRSRGTRGSPGAEGEGGATTRRDGSTSQLIARWRRESWWRVNVRMASEWMGGTPIIDPTLLAADGKSPDIP